ncbi:MAG: hypothetical protein ACLRWP_18250 [Bilophila wadsworthia]
MATGQGWLDKTSGKGAVDAALARRIVLSVQKAQAALHAGRDGGPLGRRLAILPEAGHLHVNDLLAQCQESLDYMVSPRWSSTGWPRGYTSFIATPGCAGGSQPPDPT